MADNDPQQTGRRDNDRGIRNTQAKGIETAEDRYEKQAEARLLQTRLLNKEKQTDENQPTYSRQRGKKSAIDTRQIFTEVRQIFKGLDQNITDANLQEMTSVSTKPASIPDFPVIIVILAILKDILDFVDLTGIGIIITTILSFLIATILFFWFLGKMSGRWWKKGLLKWFWKRYALAMIIEFIPFLKMLPSTTILVFLAHYRETKIVKLFNLGLEKLHSAGFK